MLTTVSGTAKGILINSSNEAVEIAGNITGGISTSGNYTIAGAATIGILGNGTIEMTGTNKTLSIATLSANNAAIKLNNNSLTVKDFNSAEAASISVNYNISKSIKFTGKSTSTAVIKLIPQAAGGLALTPTIGQKLVTQCSNNYAVSSFGFDSSVTVPETDGGIKYVLTKSGSALVLAKPMLSVKFAESDVLAYFADFNDIAKFAEIKGGNETYEIHLLEDYSTTKTLTLPTAVEYTIMGGGKTFAVKSSTITLKGNMSFDNVKLVYTASAKGVSFNLGKNNLTFKNGTYNINNVSGTGNLAFENSTVTVNGTASGKNNIAITESNVTFLSNATLNSLSSLTGTNQIKILKGKTLTVSESISTGSNKTYISLVEANGNYSAVTVGGVLFKVKKSGLNISGISTHNTFAGSTEAGLGYSNLNVIFKSN